MSLIIFLVGIVYDFFHAKTALGLWEAFSEDQRDRAAQFYFDNNCSFSAAVKAAAKL